MRKILFFLGMLIVLSGVVSAVDCGDTIYTDTVLAEDLLNCPGHGLSIHSPNIILDCNGHLIEGDYEGYLDSGVYMRGGFNVTLENCLIAGFSHGIFLYGGQFNRIINNTISEANDGIRLWSRSRNNYISNNIVFDNAHTGIALDYSYNNIVLENTVMRNSYYGIRLEEGEGNEIIRNKVSENKQSGIHILSSQNKISENIVKNNTSSGISITSAYYPQTNETISSHNNVVSKNLIDSNLGPGIFLAAYNNTFHENDIRDNSGWGIRFSNNNVDSNLFYNNGFSNNNPGNVYEPTKNNFWNLSEIGNCWDDFESNLGYPNYYEVFGAGGGIDWHPNTCDLFDEDKDGIWDDEDKCLNTEGEQIVYGCSCNQILGLKPGKDKNEECSKGIIDVFTKKIGWAKDLF